MHKVIIDTNVCISGLLFGGIPKEILRKWKNRGFIVCISPRLKAEILTMLSSSKFTVAEKAMNSFLKLLEIATENYLPKKEITIARDPKDDFLLALAEEAQADYLISGDKDLLELKQYHHTRIVSPKEFLQIIN